MTNNSEDILHYGKIRSFSDHSIEVEVSAPIACSSCEVASSCGLSNDELKIINVKHDASQFELGEQVKLHYEEKLSTKALLLVYIAPLFLVLAIMITISLFTKNELFIGLAMLVSLVPYFLLFRFFSKWIEKEFIFSIEKLNGSSSLNKSTL
jgi:positive regulator of sigma E activity